jgi:hypothetical protein
MELIREICRLKYFSIRTEQLDSGFVFPLIPALSLGEREKRSQPFVEMKAAVGIVLG